MVSSRDLPVPEFSTTYRPLQRLVPDWQIPSTTQKVNITFLLRDRVLAKPTTPVVSRPDTVRTPRTKMDVVLLRSRIVATLDADADARRRAELDLKAVCQHSTSAFLEGQHS